MAMSKGCKIILAISLFIATSIGAIRLFWGDYGTDEYRVLVNLQIIMMMPSGLYAIDKLFESL
jgi:hypothetical protein